MTRPRNFEDVLSKLTNVHKSGDTWIAPCPAPGHKTPAGHLTLTDARDKVLVTCQGGRITNTTIAKVIGANVKQVTRWARKAIKSGWIINREQRKSYPADYELGEPMPEVEGLPIFEETCEATVADKIHDNRLSFESQGVDRLTSVTDDSVPLSQESWEEVI